MSRVFLILATLIAGAAFSSLRAAPPDEPQEEWVVESLTGEVDFVADVATARGGVTVTYSNVVLTAESVAVNIESGEAVAKGSVRILQDNLTWVGEEVSYNFKTREMGAANFRAGRWPVFIGGKGVGGDQATGTYSATNVFVTTDDHSRPAYRVRAKRITIVPGKHVKATHAVLFAGGVPVFYFPYFHRNLDGESNHLSLTPGYRSRFGPYLLGTYHWFLNEQLDGAFHVDYRERRGFGAGPDVRYHLGRFGEGEARYYYAKDDDPSDGFDGLPVNEDRQRVYFSHQATLRTNLTVKAAVRYQSDENVVRDFFESEYRDNIQPSTFLEVNQLWSNWSLDTFAQGRVNDFYETVERLPEVKLSGLRQQLGETPLFYESESSAGYYRRRFADTNILMADFEAARADTFHQVLLPHTFFGWLNVTPRAGGRLTYYSEADGPGGATHEEYRSVFNTGAEVSFKASRVWHGVRSDFWDVDGLRHIVEPSVNYVYVPDPSRRPPELPQFDYESPSLRLLPIDFPDYNSIDSIDAQNVIRLGLRNKLQTKRDGQIENLVNWAIYTDWRLNPRAGQRTYADLFSDLDFQPRSWVTLTSETRTDINEGRLNIADHRLTLQPNDVWSWAVGHRYLRNGFLGFTGNNLYTSTIYYRLNENWGFRTSHQFEARDGRLEEQYYTVYRDLRSWTTALTFRIRDHRGSADDFSVAITFSLKAFPRFGRQSDSVRPSLLLGS